MASLPYKWPTVSRLYQASVPGGGRDGWAEWQGGDGGQLLFRAAGVVRGGCPELFVWWWLLFQAVTGAVWRGSKAGRQGRWRLRSGYSGRMAVREALRGSCSEWGQFRLWWLFRAAGRGVVPGSTRLSRRPFRHARSYPSARFSVAGQFREIHLAPAVIDYQALNF